ncbi:hypothetical protein C1645_823067 [Glomus cerebriforme]|uniref:Uncharacterized protein n=1 Tax=Glomus cerebriforme TaxID=658196 RepID=A0A397T055_9GLOM|nr:hypothetical protein C1645_823067 [Glomus cerebriforme]
MPLSRASRSSKNQKRDEYSGMFTSNKRQKNDDFNLKFNESDNDYSEESDYDSEKSMDQRVKRLPDFKLMWTNTAELEQKKRLPYIGNSITTHYPKFRPKGKFTVAAKGMNSLTKFFKPVKISDDNDVAYVDNSDYWDTIEINQLNLMNEDIVLEKECTDDEMSSEVASERESADDEVRNINDDEFDQKLQELEHGLTQIKASEKASSLIIHVINCSLAYIRTNGEKTTPREYKEFVMSKLFSQMGIYFDGHEREDVLQYREKFLEDMIKYEKLMPTFIGDEMQMILPEFKIIPIFPRYLHSGKNEEGWWIAEHLLDQVVNSAIPIFNTLYPNAIAVFAFDNSTNHGAMAKDGLNASNMNLNPGGKKPCMHKTYYGPNKTPQSMVFSHNHPKYPNQPKGMKQILSERGLWRDNLLADCKLCKGKTKVVDANRTDCCARKILSLQPDFLAQKSQLQEEIEKCGHKFIFYPKYHCELNYIEMYWVQQNDIHKNIAIIHGKGITGKMVEFAAKKYKSHHHVPDTIYNEIM